MEHAGVASGAPATKRAAGIALARVPLHGASAGTAIALPTRVVVCQEKVMIARRRSHLDAIATAASLALVLAALVSIDGRVREEVALRVTAPGGVASVIGQSRHLAAVAVETARDLAMQHPPLTAFVLMAAVLLLATLRK
jgi:hypothetical protein